MKKSLFSLVFFVFFLTVLASAQDGMTCSKPSQGITVCEFTDGRANVMTAIGDNVSSNWYTPEQWSERGPALRQQWADAQRAEAGVINAEAAQLHKDNVIAGYGKRYGQKHWDCDQAGGKWSDMRHVCKGSK